MKEGEIRVGNVKVSGGSTRSSLEIRLRGRRKGGIQHTAPRQYESSRRFMSVGNESTITETRDLLDLAIGLGSI